VAFKLSIIDDVDEDDIDEKAQTWLVNSSVRIVFSISLELDDYCAI